MGDVIYGRPLKENYVPASVLNSCGHTDLAVVSIELDVCSKINIFFFNSFYISKPSFFYKIEIRNTM